MQSCQIRAYSITKVDEAGTRNLEIFKINYQNWLTFVNNQNLEDMNIQIYE